jgi:hypothetical protein
VLEQLVQERMLALVLSERAQVRQELESVLLLEQQVPRKVLERKEQLLELE